MGSSYTPAISLPVSYANGGRDTLVTGDLIGCWRTLKKINNVEVDAFLLRAGLVGDSMASGKKAGFRALIKDLLGDAGFGLGSLAGTLAGGAAQAFDFDYWITSLHYTIPAGGSVTFDNDTVASVTGDTFRVYYVAENGAGTFKVQTMIDGGSWTDVAGQTNVDANNAGTAEGVVISFTKTLGNYKVRVVGLTGTVKVISAAIYNSTAKGVIILDFSQGSIDLVDMVTTPAAITDPILADAAPDLLFCETLDGASAVTTHIPTLVANFATGFDETDWVLIGVPPSNTTPGDADRLAQNVATRNVAISLQQSYWDGFAPFISSAFAISIGAMGAGDPHLTAQGALQSVSYMLAALPIWDAYGMNRARLQSLRINTALMTCPSGTLLLDKPLQATGQILSAGADAVLIADSQTSPGAGHGVMIYRNGTDAILAWRDASTTYPVARFRNLFGTYSFWPEVDGTELGITGTRWKLLATSGDFSETIKIKSGANLKAGTFTLSSGTVAVSNSSVTANSVIACALKTSSGTPGIYSPQIVLNAGIGFTANGLATDNSTYNFVILEVN